MKYGNTYEREKVICALKEEMIHEIRNAGEMTDDSMKLAIDQQILEAGNQYHLSVRERERLADSVFNSLRRLGILQELVDDKTISEIMVNGPDQIFIERQGKICKWENHFGEREELENVIQQMVGRTNRMVNETHPIVDTRLENGARVNIVLSPIALNGPIVTIRRFPENPYSMQDLVRMDSLSQEVSWFLRQVVIAGYNIFISGGTGSGKTTFLNALAGFIPRSERIITIEDSAELNIRNVENLVRMETRNANTEGENEITIRDLIRTALRMRPDRIIVGEVRGAEAIDMLQAMNTGHDGSLSTGHANSGRDMLRRLETMVMMGSSELSMEAVRGQIVSGIDLVIHLGKIRDGSRKLLGIDEVLDLNHGEIQTHALYRFAEKSEENGKVLGEWQKIGELSAQEKLRNKGLSVCARKDACS